MNSKYIPYSLEAEESLLGNILLYPDAIRKAIDAGVMPEDFYLEKNRSIYSIMVTMYENKENIDTVSLTTRLRDFGIFEKVGGFDYVMLLANSTISASNTESYIAIVKNKSLARRIIKAGEEIANDAYNPNVSINEMLESAEAKVTNVTRSNLSSAYKSADEVFDKTIKHIGAIQEAGSSITGVKTLYKDLDKRTTGFQKGDLIIIGARPSMGKTAFALNIAVNSVQVNPGAILIFSLEMPEEQVAMRMLAARSKVPIHKQRTGNLSDEEWSRLNETSQFFRKQKMFIDDSPGIKVSDMLSRARKIDQEHGLFMIVIDYIQLIQAANKSESRQQEVAEISRKLKAMARELNVPVIALSQLSREVEKRNDKRPTLSDIRESGAIEQDADLVIFLHREAYYNHEEKTEDEIEEVDIIIAKHRNGPTGDLKLAFEKDINCFYGIKSVE